MVLLRNIRSIECCSDNLDIPPYELKFLDSEVALLTANATVEAMHMQFNVDGNKYLQQGYLIDLQKDPAACFPKL